ncbi:hypothetical protein BGAL_0615g00030 [Botrytis galanthina]|uniref:Uncharacterized protein n=1 Tax=Botrytis galanthina TaxID=278940 RepID=A0A4S8QV29_9HELO|nr:hypothetical protein BGAL_0615g00030 [Botrytis galanthina]
MSQIQNQESLIVAGMDNLEINFQAGLRSIVENKAGNPIMERFRMSTSKTASHSHPAPTATSQTNVQMVRGSNQAEVRKASPPNPPKKKIRTS